MRTVLRTGREVFANSREQIENRNKKHGLCKLFESGVRE